MRGEVGVQREEVLREEGEAGVQGGPGGWDGWVRFFVSVVWREGSR